MKILTTQIKKGKTKKGSDPDQVDYKIKIIRQKLEYDPDDIEGYIALGALYNNVRKYKKAISCFDIAIKINPEHIKAYINKGMSALKIHDYYNAIKAFNKAIEIDPESEVSYKNKILAHYMLRQSDRIKECIGEASKSGLSLKLPDFISSYLGLELKLENPCGYEAKLEEQHDLGLSGEVEGEGTICD